MPDRVVRFSEQFFERLDALLPEERDAEGGPSRTDFLLLDLPPIRDLLATDFDGHTLATDDPDVRVCVGAGIQFRAIAIFAALVDDAVEAFWISLERDDDR